MPLPPLYFMYFLFKFFVVEAADFGENSSKIAFTLFCKPVCFCCRTTQEVARSCQCTRTLTIRNSAMLRSAKTQTQCPMRNGRMSNLRLSGQFIHPLKIRNSLPNSSASLLCKVTKRPFSTHVQEGLPDAQLHAHTHSHVHTTSCEKNFFTKSSMDTTRTYRTWKTLSNIPTQVTYQSIPIRFSQAHRLQ